MKLSKNKSAIGNYVAYFINNDSSEFRELLSKLKNKKSKKRDYKKNKSKNDYELLEWFSS